MKNLGRVLLFLLLTHLCLMATVSTKLLPKTIYEGDQVTFTITASGNEIKFPHIEEIAGYKVNSQATSRNITNINGKITKAISKEYRFMAQKDFTIPAIKVTIEDKEESTKPIEVKVQKQKIGKDEAFIFEMKSNKKEAYVGESIVVDFIFKKHLDIELAEANFNSPSFHDFWAKPSKKIPNKIEGNYLIYTVKYILFPQKSGNIEIEAGRMDTGILKKEKRNFFNFERVKWKTLYTKGLNIKVKPLPAGVDIYGNFKFETKIDKNSIKANEPVNLTVTIEGIGNIDDIDDFKIDIKDAIVYADKAEKKIYTNNKEELGKYTQKFAIVSDRNFTIEPLEFTFFDSVGEKVKTIVGKKFDIEVTGSIIKTTTAQLEKKTSGEDVKTKVVYDQTSKTKLILFTFAGFLLGFLTAFLLGFNFKRKSKEKVNLSLATKINKSKNDKELFSHLLPFADKSEKMKELIKQLEGSIYGNKQHQINKKKLAKNIQNYLKQDIKVNEILN